MSKRVEKKLNETRDLIDKFQRKRAIRAGEEYFTHLRSALSGMLEEVERYERWWKCARDGKNYPDGDKVPLSSLVNEISYCNFHITENFHPHSDKATMAVALLVKAFDIEI